MNLCAATIDTTRGPRSVGEKNGTQSATDRYRQPSDGYSHRPREGPEGSLRDALPRDVNPGDDVLIDPAGIVRFARSQLLSSNTLGTKIFIWDLPITSYQAIGGTAYIPSTAALIE